MWILGADLKSGGTKTRLTRSKNKTMKLKNIYEKTRAVGSDPHLTMALMTALASKEHRKHGFMEILKRLANKYGVAI